MGKSRNQKFLNKIIQRIKELREEQAITQEVFYNDTGINIGRIERGLRDFNMTTLYSICHYFKITPDEFFKKVK
jgi:transcriptional regulator with XRE-family HTH domain